MVLTDGIENVAPMIASVMPSITASTYAVGLGLPSGISVAALDALAQRLWQDAADHWCADRLTNSSG